MEAAEGPGRLWSLAAGDATNAYNFVCKDGDGAVAIPLPGCMYPGLLDDILTRCPASKQLLVDNRNPYFGFQMRNFKPSPASAVQHAIRSVLMVRGTRPYVLIVDDFRKEDGPRNYRWTMNNELRMKTDWSGSWNLGDFRMIMQPGATPTEAVLLDRDDAGDKQGLPRLLVRDLSENDNSTQPAMRMDQTVSPLEEKAFDKEIPNRLFIDRNNVVEPKYKILLFPYRTGEKLPVTKWNANKTALTIDLLNGTVDTISFDAANPDHRTRLSIHRSTSGTP